MGTQSWYQRVNLIIFGVYFVETYNEATKYMTYKETSHASLCFLAEEIIDNDLNSRPIRPPLRITGRSALPVPVRTCPTSYMGINHSPLPQNNGNLPLPFFGGNHPIVILDNIY